MTLSIIFQELLRFRQGFSFASSTAFLPSSERFVTASSTLYLSMSKQSLVHQGIHLFCFVGNIFYSCTNLFQCRYKNEVRFFTIFRSVFTFCCLVTVYTDNPNFSFSFCFRSMILLQQRHQHPVPPAAW